ncbi:hypothetical protein BpHYR1_026401 [Brachionus plicatilis]|uniref:Uncharacterized protein n=1 Tax=Brachionus plicatilis TaxID=10195 RepID=A0A3M7R544_BRAPC|nr:hypothetical protein BpHYR1_026401 [Brachionus plicatilis]
MGDFVSNYFIPIWNFLKKQMAKIIAPDLVVDRMKQNIKKKKNKTYGENTIIKRTSLKIM